jgi:ELWxxDGT repeat protein
MATLTALTTGISSIGNLEIVGNTLYFSATQTGIGNELFKSDGTPIGTLSVRDIFPGVKDSFPRNLTAVGNTLYFSATLIDKNGFTSQRLYKSDGTNDGTVLVEGIDVKSTGISPSSLTVFGNRLFYSASPSVGIGRGLYASDGTITGTVLVSGINLGATSSEPQDLTAIGNSLYFTADLSGGSNREVYKTDGTTAGTSLLKDIYVGSTSSNPSELTAVGTNLYFTAQNEPGNQELYKSDGTTTGTNIVRDIRIGVQGSNPRNLTAIGNTLYFSADDGLTGKELYKSDGTEAGTVRIKDIYVGKSGDSPFSSDPSFLTAVGNTLYFVADNGINGRELWKSDGTEAGTVLVKDINAGTSSSPSNLTAVGNTLYFTANDNINGIELWSSDGTAAGTVLIQASQGGINAGSSSSNPFNLTAFGDNTLYFTANDGKDATGNRLFKYDGTVANAGGGSSLSKLDTKINRFQNTSQPGTFLFAGEAESVNIRNNFKNFKEEGLAFQVGVEKSDPLLQPLFRFQNTSQPGTFLFVGEAEAVSVRNNFKNFKEEGLAFYVYGASSGIGTTYNRFQNTSQPGTFLFAGPEESKNILANFKNFVLEGAAFNVG